MSFDVSLQYGVVVAEVASHSEGGTYVAGGSGEAELNITYNYSWFYYMLLDKKEGLRWLNGKTATDTIERLEKAVDKLGIVKYEATRKVNGRHILETDYWAPTPGNAGYALNILLGWAKKHPAAVWEVD